MKPLATVAVLSLIALTPLFPQSAPSERPQLFEEGLCDYVGSIGSVAIQITLVSTGGNEIRGSYFRRDDLKDISLRGEYLSPRDILLSERDVQGSKNAIFRLHTPERVSGWLTEKDLDGEVLDGIWTSADGSKSESVRFERIDILSGVTDLSKRYSRAGTKSDFDVEKNVQAFYFAVLKEDSSAAGKYVHYPLSVFPGKGGARKIRSQAEFTKNFRELFSPKYVKCLADYSPHAMFANYQGVMLGDGAVWFDEKGYAITLNSCGVDERPY